MNSTHAITQDQAIKGGILLAVFIVIRAALYRLVAEDAAPGSVRFGAFLVIAFLVLSFGLVYVGFTQWIGIDLANRWWQPRKGRLIGDIGWGIGMAVVILLLSAGIVIGFSDFFGLPGDDVIEPALTLPGVILGLTFGFAIAAFQEETIFRGFFQDFFTERYGSAAAIVLQALLFSAAHIGYYPPDALPLYGIALASGIVYGLMRYFRGSVIAPFITHGLIG